MPRRTRVHGVSRQEMTHMLTGVRERMLNLEPGRLKDAIDLTDPKCLHLLVVVDGCLACKVVR